MTGGLVVDKPEGWTSHDVVGRIRRLAGTRRVGHTGTLDPFATGVLVVCIGVATRLSQLLVGCDKAYRATIRLGWATDTQDVTGAMVGERAAAGAIPEDRSVIEAALAAFRGTFDQVPPMYSAKKVDGRSLHKLARAGREIERAAVPVRVDLEIAPGEAAAIRRNDDGTVDVDVEVTCSAGTYVRTLAHDIGARLGCGAHLAALRRTRAGRFTIGQAATLDRLEGHVAEYLIPPAELVADLPAFAVRADELPDIANGRALPVDGRVQAADGADVALVAGDGRLVAIARIDDDLARPRIVLER